MKQKETVMLYISGLHTLWPEPDNGPRSLILNAIIDSNQGEQMETVKNRYLLLSNSPVVLFSLLHPQKKNTFLFDLLLPQHPKSATRKIYCCSIMADPSPSCNIWISRSASSPAFFCFQSITSLSFSHPLSLSLSAPSGLILRLRFHSSVFWHALQP